MTRAERYEAKQLPEDDRRRRLWGVWDHVQGVFVETDGDLERYSTEDGASRWCDRQRYLDQVGPHLLI